MIGRKYDEEDWVHVSSRVRKNDVLNHIQLSIAKWHMITAYLRVFDANTADFTPLDEITKPCGICILYGKPTSILVVCENCPLTLSGKRCFERTPYREIYDFADSCESWTDFVDQCGELTIKYAADLIQYLKGLIKHIEENA